LYIDGVDTVVRMAVDFGLALGFGAGDLLTALLITQFVGFPAALAFGRIGDRLGARQGILLAIVVYILAVFWAWRMTESWEFYGLAVTIGLVQGGVQALSRSLYARMIPSDKSAEFFGFYNMLGKFAAVLGPLMVGIVSLVSHSQRWGMLSVVLLFVVGMVLLAKVDIREAERIAKT
jgi:UMF1 family MFS transporter